MQNWLNLRDYTVVKEIPEEEEVWIGDFEDAQVLAAKLAELQSWEDRGVSEPVKSQNQKVVSTRWVITEKEKRGQRICKTRLVARGFEEEGDTLKTDSPTCASEGMKVVLTVNSDNEGRVEREDTGCKNCLFARQEDGANMLSETSKRSYDQRSMKTEQGGLWTQGCRKGVV